ncbi:hypothetical protein FE236_11535 [Mariprofundus erugo]|uniref:DUF4426 domain-containing protein n=1 Tax=Mariprofundus erugo TaxID=2528639 RepID=A0A5R9GN97_9PROT|nr:hypothetical protein [Mariprofundus erugo]TLS67500.1 hypothetical protein FEF65_06155 [Mariprofundus erugo]TLS74467.1 hypothetical protein FE236_11535 [Mariprofundus erugo]
MLKKSVPLWMLAGISIALLMPAPVMATSDQAGRHQIIDGVSIYFGILPIQMARNEADELNLPTRVYKENQRYYVLFAMFDAKTGKRIVNANVKARVEALGGLDFSEKALKPIHIDKLVSYGNYFHLADPDMYHIKFSVSLPDQQQPINGTFDYHRPPSSIAMY